MKEVLRIHFHIALAFSVPSSFLELELRAKIRWSFWPRGKRKVGFQPKQRSSAQLKVKRSFAVKINSCMGSDLLQLPINPTLSLFVSGVMQVKKKGGFPPFSVSKYSPLKKFDRFMLFFWNRNALGIFSFSVKWPRLIMHHFLF